MSNICRFTVPASRDIESIIDYIADNKGLDAAESYLKKINQTMNAMKLISCLKQQVGLNRLKILG